MLKPGRRWGPFAHSLIALTLCACANNSSQFESGLRDATLGAPVLSDDKPASQQAEANSADVVLSAYGISNLKPAERPALESDEGGLWSALEEHERMVSVAGNRITDEALNGYIKDVVCKISGPYCPQIRVYVLRVPDFNANMSPTGKMEVWSGLLLRARNEAEMAAVLGHEFGHFLRRHTIQTQRDSVARGNFLQFAAVALGLAGAPAGSMDMMRLADLAGRMAYSRDHEREADGYGLRVLFDNGYDLTASPALWKRLKEERSKADSPDHFNLFTASHPSIEERAEEQTKLTERLSSRITSPQKGRERYLEHILPHRAGFIEDEIARKPKAAALALLDLLIEDGVRLGELYFYKGEVHRQSADKKGPEEALKWYGKALTSEGAPSKLHKFKALAHLRLEQKAQARTEFETYLQKMPKAPDADLVRSQLEELK
ncbi:putative Peptidase M48 Ste24p [Rhodospirillaceae bacterium LM-1]|nr:putative Peptidase M48 Ste24p [Rhodospirillaceae bacterium LM-1]